MNVPYSPNLETPRLSLAAVKANDFSEIFDSYGADIRVAKYMTWPCTGEIRHTEMFTKSAAKIWEGEKLNPLRFDYSVRLKDGQRLIGVIGFTPDGISASIGYNFAYDSWGKGFGFEAASGLTDYLLSRPEIYRVWATHHPENIGSGRVLEKCGFEREGYLKKQEMRPNVSNEPGDSVLWAKVK